MLLLATQHLLSGKSALNTLIVSVSMVTEETVKMFNILLSNLIWAYTLCGGLYFRNDKNMNKNF